jgi:hypothetical protein
MHISIILLESKKFLCTDVFQSSKKGQVRHKKDASKGGATGLRSEAKRSSKSTQIGDKNTAVIAYVALPEVGSFLKELDFALLALQRVLERVKLSAVGAKRKRGLEQVQSRTTAGRLSTQ